VGYRRRNIGGALSSLFGMTFSSHRGNHCVPIFRKPIDPPCDPSALRQITVGVPRSPMASDAAMFTPKPALRLCPGRAFEISMNPCGDHFIGRLLSKARALGVLFLLSS